MVIKKVSLALSVVRLSLLIISVKIGQKGMVIKQNVKFVIKLTVKITRKLWQIITKLTEKLTRKL